MHIIAFIITILLYASYVLFMLRPFLRDAHSETRRVVELLSQLPPEVNVDDLVQRGLFGQGAPQHSASNNANAFAPGGGALQRVRSNNSMKGL